MLGDLVHLCPPAEACRDAFERMSKATVQMCLSTTGFGTQVDLARAHIKAMTTQSTNVQHPGRARQYGGEADQQRTHWQTQRRDPRLMPRFDMNLGDLFDGNVSPPEQSTAGRRTMMQSQSARPEFADSSPPNLTSEGPRQYIQGTSPMEYYKYENPLSPQQQQQYYYGNSPQHNMSPRSAGTSTSQHAIPKHDDHRDPSLDFLDFDATGAEGPVPMDADGNVDYSVLNMPSLGHGAGHSVGIDLGFGMAMDFQHDWSESANYDMLEGYFFGGAGTGTTAGQPGADD